MTNATFATGISGPALTQGTDFQFSDDRVSIPSGSQLDQNGEVLFVDIEGEGSGGGAVASMRQAVESFFSLAPVLLVVILAAVIIARIRQVNV